MPTGTEISAVFIAVALVGLAPRFSQYGRPDEAAVFVSQYRVMLSSTSSFVLGSPGSSPYVHCANPGCHRKKAARPAGESVRPYPTACGRVVSADEVAGVPALAVGAQRIEHGSFLLRHRGTGPAPASAASTSGGTAAGRLTWMPASPSGAWRPIASVTTRPRHRPGRRSGCSPDGASAPPRLCAVRPGSQPTYAGAAEKP